MLVIPGLLGFIAGKIRGGTLNNISKLPLRKFYLLFGSLFLQIAAGLPLFQSWAGIFYIVSYAILLAGLVFNLHLPGMLFLLVGTFLNALVVTANGGQMPVAIELTTLSLEGGTLAGKHTILTADTHFPLLADIIPFRLSALGYNRLFSVGDLLQMAGMFCLICRGMTGSWKPNREKEITP